MTMRNMHKAIFTSHMRWSDYFQLQVVVFELAIVRLVELWVLSKFVRSPEVFSCSWCTHWIYPDQFGLVSRCTKGMEGEGLL